MQFDTQLEALRKKFIADLPARFQEIRALYLSQTDHDSTISALRQALHRLAGLAGTFKASRVSELARNLETQYSQTLTASGQENHKVIAFLFERLETAILEYLAKSQQIIDTAIPPLPELGTNDTVICMIAAHDPHIQRMAKTLQENGYRVEFQPSLTSLLESSKQSQTLPALIFFDADKHNHDNSIQPDIQHIKSKIKNFPPLIFLSQHTDTSTRLQAVRAGASEFLEKETSEGQMLDTISKYLKRATTEKILVVDDDAITAEYIAHIIRRAGYQSQAFTEPLRIFEVLESFQPDLLILDIYMPDCSGIELAQAIRQCCCHNMMPILFLTTGTDIDQELCALSSGGDEFIRKSDPDHYLLEKLSSRLRRLNQIRALHDQVKSAQQRSERLRKSQSNFLAYVVHELKSPLNQILGFSELLQMDGQLSTTQMEMVQEIVKAGHNQLAMVEELSEQVRLVRGRLALSLTTFDITALLNQIIPNAALLGREAGISIQSRFEPTDKCYVYADQRRVEQILANLLSNAIKYNHPAGKVWIDIQKRSNGMFRITVSDTGIGIAPADREAVFEAFNRLHATQKGIDGIGIGLAICSQLITLMHGRIGVESQLGAGAKFWIELPPPSE